MAKQFRVLDQLMLSAGDKEATYDAGPAAWTLGAAFQLFEFGDAFVAWDDVLRTDRDTIHGSQFATTSEIVRQDVRLAYSEPRVRPTHLAALAALALGNPAAAVQDAALTAYRHKLIPVGAAVALPSVGLQEKASGEQMLYTGIKADTFRLARNGDFWQIEAGLIGSGSRAASATAFPAKLTSQLPLRWQDTYCWLETGTDISIDAAPTQGLENISSGTPDALRTRLVDAEFSWRNDLQADDGYAPGGAGTRVRLDHGPGRGGSIRLELLVDEATLAAERAYYTGQADCAVELEVKSSTVIAATGAYTWGFDLFLPLTRLTPIGRGVREGVNTLILQGECMDDETNPVVLLYVYDNQAAYLA